MKLGKKKCDRMHSWPTHRGGTTSEGGHDVLFRIPLDRPAGQGHVQCHIRTYIPTVDEGHPGDLPQTQEKISPDET